MEKDTPEKPEIYRIAAFLGITHGEAFLACFRVWRWADSQTDDGVILAPPKAIDDAAHLEGFSNALREVGWLNVRSEAPAAGSSTGGPRKVPGNGRSEARVEIPNFVRHMGTSAKRRMMDAVRSDRSRVRKKSRSQRDESVTPSSLLFSGEEASGKGIEGGAGEKGVAVDKFDPSAFDLTPEGLAQRYCVGGGYVGSCAAHRDIYKLSAVFREWIERRHIAPEALLREITRTDRPKDEPPWDMLERLQPKKGANAYKSKRFRE